jgi:hypothetical protein
VNNITAYEIKIAEKLEQLPVPDMADSIWASIEMQLNADLASDPTPPQKSTKGKPGLGKGFYFSVLTAIIIIAILLYKNNKQPKRNNEQRSAPKTEIVNPIADSNTAVIDPVKNNTSAKNNLVKKDSMSIPFIPGKRMSFDAASPQLVPLNKIDSSVNLLKNKTSLPSLDSSFINLPLKKGKGVKGISDSDYRISGQKDSVKKAE